MAENRCPGCGAEGMTDEERAAGMCYDCQRMQRKTSEAIGSRPAPLATRIQEEMTGGVRRKVKGPRR